MESQSSEVEWIAFFATMLEEETFLSVFFLLLYGLNRMVCTLLCFCLEEIFRGIFSPAQSKHSIAVCSPRWKTGKTGCLSVIMVIIIMMMMMIRLSFGWKCDRWKTVTWIPPKAGAQTGPKSSLQLFPPSLRVALLTITVVLQSQFHILLNDQKHREGKPVSNKSLLIGENTEIHHKNIAFKAGWKAIDES